MNLEQKGVFDEIQRWERSNISGSVSTHRARDEQRLPLRLRGLSCTRIWTSPFILCGDGRNHLFEIMSCILGCYLV